MRVSNLLKNDLKQMKIMDCIKVEMFCQSYKVPWTLLALLLCFASPFQDNVR